MKRSTPNSPAEPHHSIGRIAKQAIDPQVEFAILRLQENDPATAEKLCQQVLESNPFDADAHDVLGILAHQKGDWQLGLSLIDKAISLKNDKTDFHGHRGITLKALGRRQEARLAYEKACQLSPKSFEPIFNLAILLLEDGKYDAALKLNQKAVKLDPQNPQAHNNLGTNLQKMGRFEEATKSYQRAIKINPDHHHYYNNLATALAESDRIAAALKICDDAIARWPDYPEIYNAQANALLRKNDLGGAIKASDNVLQRQPDHVQAHYTRGMILLAQNKFEAGWRDYAWRERRSAFWPKRNYDAPEWQGDSLQNKTLLVHWEQGFGDIIQFSRYLPILKSAIQSDPDHLNARVLFDCPEKLIGLFGTNFGPDEIDDWGDTPPYIDYYIPLMSLAQHFTKSEDKIPNNIPYLSNCLSEHLKLPIEDPGMLKIGLTWASDHGDTYRRKVCDLKKLARIFKLDNCVFYGLQYGEDGKAIKRYEKADNVINLGNDLGDFTHTAAIISQLDLIISIDTYIVHLAGAMNIPTWVMLAFSPDWRWQLNRSDSPWYPSMRLFRQPKPGDWNSLISEITRALDDYRR